MFSITCNCCAAKLKVLQPGAIGQMLACPKCGEMVEIVPPPGWIAPPNPESQDASASVSNFDDIQDLINPSQVPAAKPEAKPAFPATRSSPASRSAATLRQDNKGLATQKPGSPRTESLSTKPAQAKVPAAAGQNLQSPASPNAPASTGPKRPVSHPTKPHESSFELAAPSGKLDENNLPAPDWGRRKMSRLQVGVIVSCGILGLILIVVAITTLSGKPPRTSIAKQETPVTPTPGSDQVQTEKISTPQPAPNQKDWANSPENKKLAPDVSLENVGSRDNTSTSPTPKNDSATDPVIPQPVDSVPSNTVPSNTVPSNTGQSNSTGDDQQLTQPPSLDPQKDVRESATPPAPATGEGSPQVSPLKSGSESPLANSGILPTDSPSRNELTNMDNSDLSDRLGNLSQLLASPGTSLKELSDIAEVERNESQVGMARFFIAKPSRPTPVGEPWAARIEAASYTDAPLNLILFDLTQLTGVPIELDAMALSRRGKSVDDRVSLELSSVSVKDLFDAVLAKLDLEHESIGDLEWVRPRDAKSITTKEIGFPPVSDPSPEKFQAFADNLPKLIDPLTWNAAPEQTKIEVTADHMVISQCPEVIDRIQLFINKLTAASKLKANPGDETAKNTLKTRTARAAEAYAKPVDLPPSINLRLESFLTKIYRQSNVAICIDWTALSEQGWSPQAEVPGNFAASNLKQLLNELARSLDATVLAVDEKTFVITTFSEAARSVDIELYSFQNQTLQADQIVALLIQTLGAQLRANPELQMIYEPEANCLIVSAPQSIQRQIEAVLMRLASPH